MSELKDLTIKYLQNELSRLTTIADKALIERRKIVYELKNRGVVTPLLLTGKCCSFERRNIDGGCDNCGDPCL